MAYTCDTGQACCHNQRLFYEPIYLKSFKPLLGGMHIHINFVQTIVVMADVGLDEYIEPTGILGLEINIIIIKY